VKRGVLPALLVVYVVWGSTYLAIRWALETIPPFTMAGARYLVAGGVLLAWVKLRGAPRVTFRDLGPAFLTGGLMLLCGNGGVVWAEQRIASGLAALLVAVEPLFIVALQATLPQERRRPSARALVGVAFGVTGVVLLVGPVRLGGERVDLAGAGAVLFAAFAWALERPYAFVLEMDADFSHPPRYLPALLDRAEAGTDLVLGSRYVEGGGTVNWGWLRRLISKGGSLYARTVLGLSVRDLTGGFKCFRRQVLESIDLADVHSTGYAFQIELTYRAVRNGFRVEELPIVFEDRRVGQSKMSRRIVVEALMMVWKLRFTVGRP